VLVAFPPETKIPALLGKLVITFEFLVPLVILATVEADPNPWRRIAVDFERAIFVLLVNVLLEMFALLIVPSN
jgi:hypothetical protein